MRIGIVNDMEMALEILSGLIKKHTRHTIAWKAKDGIEAVEKCGEDTPDLVLMDLVMPLMEGDEATRLIMKKSPCAILIVTSSISGNMSKVYEAMGYGALDVVKTPAVDLDGNLCLAEDFLKKLEIIEKLLGYRNVQSTIPVKTPPLTFKIGGRVPELLLLGASTGGPMAVAALLEKLPEDAPFATVVIQHVDQEFSAGLRQWLDDQTRLEVELVKEGDTPKAGHVYLAGKNEYLQIDKEGKFFYRQNGMENPYRPSIDIFFASVARHWPKIGVAALLTGMGVDGAQGLKELKNAGWHTIAEDRSTCVVYGMPKVAVQIDAACSVLPLDEIAKEIMRKFTGMRAHG